MSEEARTAAANLAQLIPSVRGMSTSQLISLIEVLGDATAEAKREIAVACEREGHQWEHPQGRHVQIVVAGSCKEYSPFGECTGTLSWSDEWELQRQCLRCGVKQTGKQETEVVKTHWR